MSYPNGSPFEISYERLFVFASPPQADVAISMKIRVVLIAWFLVVACTGPATAQLDSAGKKYYAYAHFYSNKDDENTEYISTVFCWVYNPLKKTTSYPGDYLTTWAISNFKAALPRKKIKDCSCRFQADSTAPFYSDAEALRLWMLESQECTAENISVVIVPFPEYVNK